MRVLHVTSHLHIGGITRYVLSLSERLVKRGHHVIIAADGGHAASQVTEIGATHWPFSLHTSAEWSPQVFWSMRQLAARVRQEPVDVMHAHTRVGQVVADHVAHHQSIPYVTTWHGIYQPRLGRRLWPCTGKMTIAISGLVRQDLLDRFHVPERQVRCIYNGVDVAYYAAQPDAATMQALRQRWNIPTDRPVVGAIGRMAAGRVKGFDTLLVAASLLEDILPECHVVIVGDGPRRPFLEDIATRLGVRTRVHFVGEMADIRVPLALMDVFVFTSRWPEAFGLTLVEAMAAGKPVVATQAGAVPEVIRHGVDGWLVPSDDPASMAEGIVRLVRDHAVASQLGRQAHIRVRDTFSLDRMATEVEAVYQEVVSPGLTSYKATPTP